MALVQELRTTAQTTNTSASCIPLRRETLHIWANTLERLMNHPEWSRVTIALDRVREHLKILRNEQWPYNRTPTDDAERLRYRVASGLDSIIRSIERDGAEGRNENPLE